MRVEATGEVLQVPIKHGEGQFVASPEELVRIESEGLIWLRYSSPAGVVDDAFNPNGSSNGIAGLRNERGNVLGLMPHPEHAVDPTSVPRAASSSWRDLLAAAHDQVSA